MTDDYRQSTGPEREDVDSQGAVLTALYFYCRVVSLLYCDPTGTKPGGGRTR